MKLVLNPIVMVRAMGKMGIMKSSCNVHTVTTMEKKVKDLFNLPFPSQCERDFIVDLIENGKKKNRRRNCLLRRILVQINPVLRFVYTKRKQTRKAVIFLAAQCEH